MKTNHLSLRPQRKMSLNNIALLIVLGASPALANLVQDGSFQDPVGTRYYLTGPMGAWTVSVRWDDEQREWPVGIYQSGFFTGANVTDGNQAFDLGMGGHASGNSLSQVLPTVAGLTYRLSFDWGSEYANGTSAFVSVGDLNENLIDPARGYGNTWIVNSSSFLFIASGNDTLTFSEPAEPEDWWGLALDNVSVLLYQALPLPALSMIRSGDALLITWPASVSGAVLETTDTLSPTASWVPVAAAPVTIGDETAVAVDIEGGMKFYRLRKP